MNFVAIFFLNPFSYDIRLWQAKAEANAKKKVKKKPAAGAAPPRPGGMGAPPPTAAKPRAPTKEVLRLLLLLRDYAGV